MIVRFVSSETGEVLMFAETARALLQVVGKETTARGTFIPAEMPAAAQALREAVRQAAAQAPAEDDEEEEERERRKERPVSLGQRAWPLIDMLERTGRAGPEAHIVWEAAEAF